MKFPSLAALEVVKMATSSEPVIKISSKWRHFRFSEGANRMQISWDVLYHVFVIFNSVLPGDVAVTEREVTEHVTDWASEQMPQKIFWWQFKIGSGNVLMPSGNKPLPEQMLTKIYVTILLHYRPQRVNSMWIGDTMWRHQSDSTLDQVSLRAFRLIQFWVIVNKQRDTSHFRGNIPENINKNEFENYLFKVTKS